MRWLPSISFSSSSSMKSNSSFSSSASLDEIYSSSSSSSSSSKKNDQRRRNGGFRILGPSLTRQRKLRHLSDRDVIVGPPPKSKAESGEFVVALSPSPSGYDASTRSTCSVPVPLPLPLPLPEGDADSRLPSPKQRDRGEATGDPPNVAMKSVFSGRDMRKTTENFEKRSSRMVRQHLNSVGTSLDDFMVQVPTRSAPTSPFGSPLLSPQRTGVADLFPYYYITPGRNQVWSAPEMATYDVPGLPPPAFFDYTGFSTDSSPLHSPPHRSPHRNPRSPSGPASPLHAKLSLEALTARRESNGHVNTHRESNGHIHHESNGHINAHRESNGHINVHPLPLPPGAAMPSPSAPVPQVTPKSPSAHVTQVTPKSDFLPMNNQWQKGKLIGRGTFGSVYVASNRETGALCAMKEVEIFPDDPKSAECIKQLEQEIELLSQLKHPNIVQYYGSEIVDDRFYIYLEYVHPGSINKYVHEHCGAITESVIRNFTRHILSGLAYLHSTKTIHRDIKGANLLVDASGVVKLADFGMAKHLTGQRADLSLKGSPYWMAPELMQAVLQKDNSSDLALAVDIWSLGCTIIEMLTGKPPWSEYEGAAAMFKVMRDTPPIPKTLSPEGKDFLRCCFRRNPAERPSASMLLEHRFLRVSAPPDVPSCNHSFNGMKLTDKPHSPRAREIKLDQLPILPSSQRTKRGTPDCMTTGTSFMQSSFSPLKANGVIMKLPT